TPTSSSSIAKRGLSYNNPTYTIPFSTTHITWTFNWYSALYTPSGVQTGYNTLLTFIPMLWSSASDLTSVWVANANAAIRSGADALLGFNEPDGCSDGGSCMDVATAVSAWKTWMEPFAGQVKLGAPGVTNGGAPMGITWLQQFLGNCTACHIDFVPIHWYYDCSTEANRNSFQTYVQGFHEQVKKPLWITEFGCTSGDEASVEAFLKMAVTWLDGQSYVERYAYFMDAQGYLINSTGGLSTQGGIYNTYT
ncbi:glycoside hydrolase family 128 protein, partial [Saccharata proteae CBS 121410]